ncbi:MAG: hypothetical protein M0C28_11825 [Candidatus Moduliflexus flocculans]|nr:hypothetical protein [Candidatus Moduliflexus flocculans]
MRFSLHRLSSAIEYTNNHQLVTNYSSAGSKISSPSRLFPEANRWSPSLMATSSIPQVKTPLANMNALSCIPNAGMNELAALTLDDLGVIRDCSQACEPVFGYLFG